MNRRGTIRRLCDLAIVTALVLPVGVPASVSASAVPKPYFVDHATKSSLFEQWALHPQAVRSGNTTYIAYQGPGLDPYVVAFNHAIGV